MGELLYRRLTYLIKEPCMKSFFVLAAALGLAACGQAQQVQQGCDPRYNDCYGRGVGRDSSGLLLAAGLGAGAGYLAGRMHNNNQGYQNNNSYAGHYGSYHGVDRRPVIIQHNHYRYYGSQYSTSSPMSSPSPTRSAAAPTRTMFRSARR